ncbi:MAG: hypothetical protein Kilf2KO_01690 [Rhodospirillales bacterium]
MTREQVQGLARLRSGLAAHYRADAANQVAAAASLTALAQRLEDPGVALTPGAGRRDLPALALLPEALAAARQGPLGVLADALTLLEPALSWIQNANYSAERVGRHYLDGYAYTTVMGPDGLLLADDLLVSILLIGPNRHYPAHAHAAEEVYHPLAGRALWWREGEDWEAREPGAAIHHRPWQAHATRTGAQTLLAVASWRGDPRRKPALTDAIETPALPEW